MRTSPPRLTPPHPAAMVRGALAALLALAAAACSDLGLGPGDRSVERILFLSNLEGGMGPYGQPRHDIYRMNADGTGLENLTRSPGTYRNLGLSPGGRTLVFDTYPGNDIWVMNVDGSGLARLTNRDGGTAQGRNYHPRWSRDGSRIAFLSDRGGRPHARPDVFVMNANGGSPRNLTAPLGDEQLGYGIYAVGWSPSGQVTFEVQGSAGGASFERVYVVSTDGTGLRTLVPVNAHSVAWSPDGSRLAFVSGWSGLSVMNADGTGEPRLVPGGGFLPRVASAYGTAYDPWSPDGTRIAFQRVVAGAAYGQGTIHVLNADGTGEQQVTPETAAFNGWSPRGDRILFTSAADGSGDVVSIKPTGGDRLNLTRAHSDILYDERDALWLRRR